MTKVLAQGVFDIIHPGHLHYLKKSKKLGTELVVIIARDNNTDKETYFSEDERKEIVESLKPVDKAVLGHKTNIFKGLKQVNPDIITLGHDQSHNKERIKEKAEEVLKRKIKVERIEGKGKYSSKNIRKNIQEN